CDSDVGGPVASTARSGGAAAAPSLTGDKPECAGGPAPSPHQEPPPQGEGVVALSRSDRVRQGLDEEADRINVHWREYAATQAIAAILRLAERRRDPLAYEAQADHDEDRNGDYR